MLNFAARRVVLAVLVALTVSILVFLLVEWSTNVALALAGEDASSADIEKIMQMYGLDRPMHERYATWLFAAMQGDFGKSLFFPETVWELIAQRLPVTLKMAVVGLAISLVLGIPLGVLAALRPDSLLDRFAMSVAVTGQAIPLFVVCFILMIVFSLKLGWTPISGDGGWDHYILPGFALGYYAAPPVMRLTRSGMLEVLGADYIRTAYAKGLRPMRVLFKHALRNAVIPVVALASVQFGHMASGTIIVEAVFSMQGIGLLTWDSVLRGDMGVIQAILLIVGIMYIGLAMISDLINAWLDPRIRVN